MLINDILHTLEVLSLISFAISGAYSGISNKYDIFGIFIVSFATSTGGGMLRDILLGNYPISWMRNNNYADIIIISCIFSIFYFKYIKYLNYILFIFDSLGLGIFSVLGIEYSIKYGLGPFLSILIGMINASFGGILRDILCKKTPVLFYKEMYASVSMLGGILFFILKQFSLSQDYICYITILFIFIFRIIVFEYNISLSSIYKNINKLFN